ncbi:MAG: LptF/LptG family permease [Gemmatimonadota bacterium]
MGILTRYLLRAHAGPFFFALTALTGLIFLNAVAQRMDRLAGKGLGWDVIGEFLLLSLPHTVALTLPMAILVAVLYSFSQLSTHNELTAMAAGGIRPVRLLVPLVLAGGVLAAGMLYFNDRVLPEANHRLKNLIVDITRKSPTFELREQVVNEIRTVDGQATYFLQARRIDPATNDLEGVVIYDLTDPTRRRTIHAGHGSMAFSAGRTDLYLTLYDGVILEIADERPGGFQRMEFQQQIIPLRGVSDVLERQMDSHRTNREMSIAMLQDMVRQQDAEMLRIQEESKSRSMQTLEQALGRPLGSDGTGVTSARNPTTSSSSPPRTPFMARLVQEGPGEEASALPPDGLTQSHVFSMRSADSRAEVVTLTRARYSVEIHKKYAISLACVIFILLGGPLAMRFPGGGVGMVIAVSVAIFGVYWVGLIGGERLATRGVVSPFLAMWAANFIAMAAAIWLLLGMGRAMGTNRGGGFDEFLYRLRQRLLGLEGR